MTRTGATSSQPERHPNMRPRDAATLIVVDRSQSEPKVLMGRRSDKHVFMPGKFVFPGGRVDRDDLSLAASLAVPDSLAGKLQLEMKGRPSARRASALALAAIRETFEETGLLIGKRAATPQTRSAAWSAFFGHGVVPDLAPIGYFCRAITPPGRSRRFDARFFCVDAGLIVHRIEPDNRELLDLHWLTLADACRLDVPNITLKVLGELGDRLKDGPPPWPDAPVPFYFKRGANFRRELL
ncbi:MAG: NUDIX hydrolase [Pseudomonadota bacterium]|nr:NUDIX hydrolase [Pseudomonadota bacterium]